MKLNPIDVEHLQYLEASQFITRLFSNMEVIPSDVKKDKEMFERFQKLRVQSEEFYKALVQIKAMAESKELEDLDLERDHMMSTVRLHIASFRYRKEPEIKNAFAAANIILSKYEGLEAFNYEAESKAIQKFLDEWDKGENANHVSVLGLGLHLAHLKEAAYAFDNVFNNRSVITLSREVYDAKALKSQMFGTYSSLARYILAMCDFKKDEKLYPPLLDVFNNGRKYFADVIARRKGHGKGGNTPEEKKGEE